MAKTIKGLTIEIDGNTTKLSKALDGVNKESAAISSELKEVNNLLKFNPKNTIALEQKQQLLADAVENTKKKLETLEKAQKSVSDQFSKGDIGEEEYRAFQREIIKTKSQLENFSDQLNDAQADFAYFATGADEAADELKKLDKNTDKAADGIEKLKDSTKGTDVSLLSVGTGIEKLGNMAMNATGKIIDLAGSMVDAHKEISGSMSAFEANAKAYGLSIDDVKESLTKMVGITGELDSSTEAINNLISAGLNADQVAEAVNQFAGAVTQFPDTLKFESLADSLQESIVQGELTGQFAELLERLGYDIEKVNEEFGKASEKGTAFDLAMQLLADQGLGQVGDEFIELNQVMYDNNQKNLELQESMATLGEQIMPILNTLIGYAIDAITWFTNLDSTWQKVIVGLVALIGFIGALSSLLGPLILLVGGFNVAMLPTIGIVAGVVAGITLLVAAGVALYKNWDKVKKKAGELWNSIKEKFNNIRNKVKGVVEDIKGFFNFKWEIPKIKLPHFKVSGSANPLKWLSEGTPKLSVEWYSQGAIFTKPTLLGGIGVGDANNGRGSNAEAVLPIDKLPQLLMKAGIGLTVNNYSPEALSPSESARQFKKTMKELSFSL